MWMDMWKQQVNEGNFLSKTLFLRLPKELIFGGDKMSNLKSGIFGV